MKNTSKWNIALLSAILIFGLFGCEDGNNNKIVPVTGKGDAFLTGIKIGEPAIDMVGEETIGEVILEDDFETGNSMQSYLGSIIVKNTAALSKPVVLTISKGATAVMVRLNNANAPAENVWTGSSTFESGESMPSPNLNNNNNFIFIRIFSEDESVINHYVVQVMTQSGAAIINSVKIGTLQVTNYGTPAETITAALAAKGKVVLKGGEKNGTLTAGHTSTAQNDVLKIAYAIQRKTVTDEPADSAFTAAAPAPWTFEDEDTIFIRVTSQNGELTNYYAIGVEIGRDATLNAVSINGVNAPLGTPHVSSPALAEAGLVEAGEQDTAVGSPIVVTISDTDASAIWINKKKTDAAPVSDGEYTSPASPVLTNGDLLYIKVISANTLVTNYYKIEVQLLAFGFVLYGKPNIINPADPDNIKYIDPLWTDPALGADKLPIYDISRANTAEMNPTFPYLNPVDTSKSGHTTAWAKAMWSDEGLYIYANIDFHDFYASAGNKTSGIVTARTFMAGPSDDSQAHNGDNLEIFTNERFQQYKTGNYGNQFRIEPQAVTATTRGGRISGNSGNPPSGVDPIALFRSSNNYNAWVRTDGGGKQIGYTVIARVPWIFIGNANADAVFDAATGLVKVVGETDGPTLGMELQLNTSTTTGNNRDAILTWNGIGTQSYQNCGGYGRIRLILGEGRERKLEAEQPRITTHPANTNYTYADVTATEKPASMPALTVAAAATTPPPAELSYQWYIASTAEGAGTLIPGAAAASYIPTLLTTDPIFNSGPDGNYKVWYYAVVTNSRTIPDMTIPSKSVTSNRAEVQIDPIGKPNITAQPVSAVVPQNWTVADRTITVTEPAGGSTSYQWYSAATAEETGAPISAGGTANSLAITDSTQLGTTYYWVVVTDTVGSASSSIVSNKITVKIVSESFDVDLTRRFTGSAATPSNNITNITSQHSTGFRAPPAVTILTDGISANFQLTGTTGTNQSLCFALTSDQIALLRNSDVTKVKVEMDIDPPATTPSVNFQAFIGNPRVNNTANYQGFTPLTAAPIDNAFKVQTLPKAASADNDLANSAFVLRKTPNTNAGAVVIRFIKITVLPSE